jgi:hypothetical protein
VQALSVSQLDFNQLLVVLVEKFEISDKSFEHSNVWEFLQEPVMSYCVLDKTRDRAMFLTALMGANQDNKRGRTILSHQKSANLLKEISSGKLIKIVLYNKIMLISCL